MSVFTALNKLKTNIFGGPGNTGFTKPPSSLVQDIGITPSPTGLLEDNPLHVSTFSYPLDVQSNFQNGHYMLFYVNVQNKTKYKYKSPGSENYDIGDYKDYYSKTTKPGTSNITRIKGANAGEVAYQKNRKIKEGRQVDSDTILQGGEIDKDKKGVSSLFNDTRRIQESVAIYLPPNVADNTTAGYNDMRTGLAGFLAARGVDAATSDDDAEKIAREFVGAAKGMLSSAAMRAVSEVAEIALGAEGTAQLANKAFGVADNPYMEVLFDAMSLRTFTYNFKFAPKSEEETAEVQNIIRVFRFHMTPELRGGQSRFLGLPSQFDIHYMYQPMGDGQSSNADVNPYYNKIATCVLSNCTVNYTPDGVKSFDDGAPTQITMSLTFKETEMLTKEKVALGF